MKRFSLLVLLCMTGVANAATFNSLDALTQPQFRILSENLTASTHYKGIAPAEPLGVLGFDVGIGLSSTTVNEQVFDIASDNDFDVKTIILPRLSVQKGLPFGLDVAASISAAPGTDIKLLGAEVRYAIVKGNIALPAIGVRASYSTLQGLSQLEVDSAALELTISKGFVNLTPYAGAGTVRSNSDPKGATTITKESYSQSKVYVGLNLNLGFNFTVEADRTGDYTSYSIKTGFRF